MNPLSEYIFWTSFIPLWVFYSHTFRTSWIYLWVLFIWGEELLFPYFRSSSSQFLNFLHSTIKTSWILFQNIFSELLLSHFECFIFTPLPQLEYIFQNFLSESKNFFFPILGFLAFHYKNILNPLSEYIFWTSFISVWVFYIHTFTTSLIYLSELFIWV